ncbi:MAG: hypothetical protein KDD14_26385, partial [Saprospiraceae bacterium]|nr:hypothetical protein [Saprospiraceae bacterium]
TLDKTGLGSVTAAQVNNGSTDNCADAQYLTYSVSPNAFNCSNVGDNSVVLTVTDPCGNASTCTATVNVVEGIAPCSPQYTVATTCMDNATTLDNGQFMDVITVKSLAMQTWKIASATGLYSTGSSAPPAAPAALATGTLFTSGNADGIDNDGDGTTDESDEMVYYTLKALHVDCQGYTLVIDNVGGTGQASAAVSATISNKACY